MTGNATAVQTTTSRLDRDGWDPASRDASSTPDESASQDLAVALSVRLPGAPLDEVVLASCGTQFTWEDVVGWMRDDGSWAMAARRAAEGASLAADGVAAPSADRLRAQAQQFRRARHLVAGEDLLRWLAHWGISEEEWVDWLDRTLRREAAATPSRLTRAVDEQATWVEVVCSGDLEEAASDLVRVVASWAERTGGSPPPARGRFEALRRAADELASVPVPRADIERAVTGNAAAWVQVALEWADFGTLDAAREAVATMRDDAMPLGAVAELARVEADDAVVRAEDLDARTRAVAISAPIDSPVLVGTSQDPGVVAVVRARRHPSADHPDDAALAVELCVQERVQAAIDRWVTRRA
ncbi:MAG: hypothetical protein M0Z46_08055 [Actinomycetota bacterium]|nr:hypothetical protein [Actinomycetota bacterium]